MRNSITALMALLPLAASCAAEAKGMEWRCATPYGSYDYTPLTGPYPRVRQVTGKVDFNAANSGPKWRPQFQLMFQKIDPEGPDCQCSGIRVQALERNPDMLDVRLVANGKEVPLGLVPRDKPFVFDFRYDGQDRVDLYVGTGHASGSSEGIREDKGELSCSSIDVAFRDIMTHQTVNDAPPAASDM